MHSMISEYRFKHSIELGNGIIASLDAIVDGKEIFLTGNMMLEGDGDNTTG